MAIPQVPEYQTLIPWQIHLQAGPMTASLGEKDVRKTEAVFATEDLTAFPKDIFSLGCQGPL